MLPGLMVTYKPYSALPTRAKRGLAVSGVLLVAVLCTAYLTGRDAPLMPQAGDHGGAVSGSERIPALLSSDDKARYQEIFRAQKAADWARADVRIAELDNTLLLGQVLAERYLHRHYDTTADQLAAWLKDYSDHPQADDIYDLALRKKPALKATLAAVTAPAKLQGYGDGNGAAVRFDDDPQAKKTWQGGLDAWRSGNKAAAAASFAALAAKPQALSDWQYSAACFWAYRAYLAIGEDAKADRYLRFAAGDPRNFYGILARKQLNRPLGLDTKEQPITRGEVAAVLADPSAARAVALAQVGLADRADAQLRALFPQADAKEKWLLLKLARALDLASVQIAMAKQLGSDERPLDFAKYPAPNWQPRGGFSVDPALLYALMRQESGFRASAIGPGGSLGLMQLMPQTASQMQRRGTGIGNASEPVANITLGERYVAHLLAGDVVEGNLFYMLAAYNAGPGRLQEWQDSIGHNDDPLLFVESIPYAVTRYYVMQVMTNYWIYSELAGTPSHSVYALLHGNWPIYRVQDAPLANAD